MSIGFTCERGWRPSTSASGRRVISRSLHGAIISAVVVAISGAIIGAWTPASAQSDDEHSRAKALFQEGVKLFNMGQFAEACPKFEASLELFAGVGTRGKLAECYERTGRTASAWRLYLEVEKLARQMNDTRRADVAAARAEGLETRLARLTINPGPSVELEGFAIERDRVKQASRVYGIPVVLDPGSYRVRATASGYVGWTGTVKLVEGDSAVLDVPPLTPQGSPEKPERPVSTGRIVGLSLMGAGVVSFGAMAFFGLQARSTWLDINEDCRDVQIDCELDDPGKSTDAVAQARSADLFGVVGLVAVGAGTILWLRSRKGSQTEETQAWRLTPTVGADTVGLTLSGHL